MFYYEVFVRDVSYKGNEPLTYSSTQKIEIGGLVVVPLKRSLVSGFTISQTSKPAFNTKDVHEILDLPPLPRESIELAQWMLTYYPSSVGVIAQHFIPQTLSNKHRPESVGKKIEPNSSELPNLTSEQQKTLHQVNNSGTFLLHGETASGKTRVYIELAAQAVTQGRSAIILTPEIGLTPQIAASFRQVFGDEAVLVTHSQLTEKQRAQLWTRMLCAHGPMIIIGPRSALFAPLNNIDLIVLDESHEPTYKQDQLPHYHAARVAAQVASLHSAKLIIGSATPSVVDYFLATQKRRPIIRMTAPARASNFSPPDIQVIDIKDRTNFSRSQHLSNALLGRIEQSIQNHEQSLLFLNRRGTARTVLCEHCGWQATCPHCDLPFTYHGDSHTLRCHTCGAKSQAVSSCPVCKHTSVVLKNIGTKAIANEITSIFPQAKVDRFDNDNKKSERLEQKYDEVLAGNTDILVGTQMLVKGLDLPKLSTIGVVIADTSLYLPDYGAQERTYQLLRQVIGRVGRGHRDGNVVIQTYAPENAVLGAAIGNHWGNFYENELAEREKFLFPPFCFLLKLTCRRASPRSAEQTAHKLTEKLLLERLHITIDGPSPSFHEKIGKAYEWQLVVKARNRNELLKIIPLLPSGWSYDIDPLQLL